MIKSQMIEYNSYKTYTSISCDRSGLKIAILLLFSNNLNVFILSLVFGLIRYERIKSILMVLTLNVHFA